MARMILRCIPVKVWSWKNCFIKQFFRLGAFIRLWNLPEETGAQKKEQITIPARPDVKNFSYAVVDGDVYFRENSVMRLVELNEKAKERVCGMVELRRIVNELIEYQLEDYPDETIQAKQAELNTAYDAFTEKNGLINNRQTVRFLPMIPAIIFCVHWKMWMRTESEKQGG